MSRKVYKYNMVLYYQMFAFFFVSLALYVLLRLQFVGFDWDKIIHDSIFYLFVLFWGYILFSIFYYQLKKKEIIVDSDRIIVKTKFEIIDIPFDRIESIKVKREHKFRLSGFLRTVKIMLKNGSKRYIIIRPFDYENEDELLNDLLGIQEKIKYSQ